MSADARQIGGDHYKTGGEEHWTRVHRLGLDYFQACITKYVERCWKKNGVEDLLKAQHFLEKYIELNSPQQQSNGTGVPYNLRVKMNGWNGFTFEGANISHSLYTCNECKEQFWIPMDTSPFDHHNCKGLTPANGGE